MILFARWNQHKVEQELLRIKGAECQYILEPYVLEGSDLKAVTSSCSKRERSASGQCWIYMISLMSS